MKVKVIKTVKTEEEVDLTLPYYFLHDCGGDDYSRMRHGKIEAERTTVIALDNGRGSVCAEIEIERCSPSRMSCYLTDEYRSTEAEYLKAKASALEIMNGA